MQYLANRKFHSFKTFLFYFFVYVNFTINTCSDDVKCGTAWIQVFLHALYRVHTSTKTIKKNANVQKKAHSPNSKLVRQKIKEYRKIFHG